MPTSTSNVFGRTIIQMRRSAFIWPRSSPGGCGVKGRSRRLASPRGTPGSKVLTTPRFAIFRSHPSASSDGSTASTHGFGRSRWRAYLKWRLIWKQRQAVSGGASLIGRIVIVDDADLLSGDFEPGGILLTIILNQAIAVGFADSFGFVLCLCVRDHIADLFAGMHIDAIADQFTGGECGARLDVVFFDLAAQDLLDDQQTRIDPPAFDLGEARFVDSARILPAMAQLIDVLSLR